MNGIYENKGQVSQVIIFIILVLTAVSAPLSLNKVSPIANNLMEYFEIGETQLGMLISVFSLTGIVLALPDGIQPSYSLHLLLLLVDSSCFLIQKSDSIKP